MICGFFWLWVVLLGLWDPFVGGSCPSDTLALYELHFETLWHRKDFPKHYPEWRPPASWSKLIGFTHDSNFSIFHKGEVASDALKQFLKSTKHDLFDLHTQGFDGVFDQFTAAPIKSGVGEAKLVFHMDHNHTKVSMISKILPSPDWFIGIDTYDLCPNERWLQYVHVDTTPLDGGTDKGLTFSSPEWPTIPREKIQPITSYSPNHPAGSFYYPELDSLPPIAQFTIKKVKEYSLKDISIDTAIGHYLPGRRDIYRFEVSDNDIPRTQMDDSSIAVLNDDDKVRSKNDIPTGSRSSRRRKKKHNLSRKSRKYKRKKFNKRKNTTTDEPPSNTTDVTEPGLNIHNFVSISPLSPDFELGFVNRSLNVKGRRRIPGGDGMSVTNDIVKYYQKEHREMIRKRKMQRKRRRQQLKKIKPPRDCRVSDWSSWSACSKTCGIGEQSRTRAVTKRARRGGKPCPILVETTWCGSVRRCKRNYFNWSA